MAASKRTKLSMEFLTLKDHFVTFLSKKIVDPKSIAALVECKTEEDFFDQYTKLVTTNSFVKNAIDADPQLQFLKAVMDDCANRNKPKDPEISKLIDDALKYKKTLEEDFEKDNQQTSKPGFKRGY